MAVRGEPSVRAYLHFMLRSPITAWWAVATGVIEMLGFGLASNPVTVNKWWFLILVLVVSFSVMIGFLILWKGWPLYSEAFAHIAVSQVVRVDDEHVFLLDGIQDFRQGSILEVYRTTEDVDVSIGFVQAIHQKDNGEVQAEPVWIRPGHLRDIEMGAFSRQSLQAYQTISTDTLKKWIDDEAEARVQDLLRRGGKE